MSSGIRRKGKVKWFNVVKGYGFIVPEDGLPDVFVHQNVIHMEGFRSLDENEEVEFESHDTEKGVEATLVTGPEGKDCKGSSRRPVPKRRVPKLRCYNCGRFSDHIAAKCPFEPAASGATAGQPPQNLPKLCYHCKSDQHLLKDCPDAPAHPAATTSPTANPQRTGGRAGRGGPARRGGNSRGGKGNQSKPNTQTTVEQEHAKLPNGTSANEEGALTEIASLSINANDNGAAGSTDKGRDASQSPH